MSGSITANSLIAAIQLIAPTNKLLKYTDMKWIKGKPKAEDIDKVIMRRISNRLFVITQVYEYDSVQLDTSVETVLWEDVEWLDESAPLSEGDGKYTRADMRKAIIFGSKMMYKDGVPPNANEQDDFIDLIKQ